MRRRWSWRLRRSVVRARRRPEGLAAQVAVAYGASGGGRRARSSAWISAACRSSGCGRGTRPTLWISAPCGLGQVPPTPPLSSSSPLCALRPRAKIDQLDACPSNVTVPPSRRKVRCTCRHALYPDTGRNMLAR